MPWIAEDDGIWSATHVSRRPYALAAESSMPGPKSDRTRTIASAVSRGDLVAMTSTGSLRMIPAAPYGRMATRARAERSLGFEPALLGARQINGGETESDPRASGHRRGWHGVESHGPQAWTRRCVFEAFS